MELWGKYETVIRASAKNDWSLRIIVFVRPALPVVASTLLFCAVTVAQGSPRSAMIFGAAAVLALAEYRITTREKI